MAKRNLVLANNPLLSGPKFEERAKGGIPYREVQIETIDTDPNQPRVHFDESRLQELCDSIKTYGVLSPLIVKPSTKAGRYQLVAGERRLRASLKAGLKSIPVILNQEVDTAEENTLAMQLVENLQRADLTPLERAHAIGALKETFDLSIRQVADKLGISKSMVQRSLDILDLPDDLLNALREGASESKVLLIAKIDDADIRASYLKDLDALTRTQIKKDIDKELKDTASAKEPLSADDKRVVDELMRALGLKVKMSRSADTDAGKLTIDFYSEDDLKMVFRKLVANGQ